MYGLPPSTLVNSKPSVAAVHPVDDMTYELEAVVLLLALVGAVAVCSFAGWLEWRHRHGHHA